MATNCLVKKLKDVFNNDNLPVLHAIRISYTEGTSALTYIKMKRTSEDNLYLKSNKGVFDNSSDEYTFTTDPTLVGNVFVYSSNGDPFFVNIKNKHGIIHLRIEDSSGKAPSGFAIDGESFKYCENLEEFQIGGYPTETNINFIGYCKNLTSFKAGRGKWFGTIENVVETFCREFPTKSKELSISFYKGGDSGGNVTFNGTTFLNDGDGKIVFNSGTASVYDVTDVNNPVLIGTYNGTTWTYA